MCVGMGVWEGTGGRGRGPRGTHACAKEIKMKGRRRDAGSERESVRVCERERDTHTH